MNFLVLGYYGFFNSGDDAILHAVCQDIKAQNKNNNITVMSKNPESTMEEYGVNAINRFKLADVIKEIRKADIVVFGGGSLLQNITSNRSLQYYLAIMNMAIFFKKKTILYANGVGPIFTEKMQSATAKVLNKFTKVTVRDPESAKFLYSIGVKADKVTLTADPVYNIEFDKKDINKIFERERIDLVGKEFVSVYFRKFGEDENYIKNCAKVFDGVYNEFGYPILFVPMEHENDRELSLKIQKEMNTTSYIFDNRVRVDEMFEIIGHSKVVLGMRLHSLIYSSVQNTPMIAFSYDPKVDSFGKQLGVSVFEYNNFKDEEVLIEIKNILENYEKTKSDLSSKYAVIKEKSLKNRTALDELVRGKR